MTNKNMFLSSLGAPCWAQALYGVPDEQKGAAEGLVVAISDGLRSVNAAIDARQAPVADCTPCCAASAAGEQALSQRRRIV